MPSHNRLHSDKVEINEELVRMLLARQFPQGTKEKLTLLPEQGTNNLLYRLGEKLLIRFPRVGLIMECLKEWALLPKLKNLLPLPIPEIVATGTPSDEYPFPWLIVRWLEGETLYSATVEETLLAEELSLFIRTFSTLPAAGGPTVYRGQPLARLNYKVLRAIPELSDLYDQKQLQEFWSATLAVEQWNKAPVWIHGDLHAGNILAHKGKVSGILDFGLSGVGDPACDLLPAWTLLKGEGREKFRSLLSPDEATWIRGRGWAAYMGIVGYPNNKKTNPTFALHVKRSLDEALQDFTKNGR